MKYIFGLSMIMVMAVACSKGRQYSLPPVAAKRTPTPGPSPSLSAASTKSEGLKTDSSDPSTLKIISDGQLVVSIPGAKAFLANSNFVGFQIAGPGGEMFSRLYNGSKKRVIEECECDVSANKYFAVAKFTKAEKNKDGEMFYRTTAYNEVGDQIFNIASADKDTIETVMSDNYVGYISPADTFLYNVQKGEVIKVAQAVKIELKDGKAIVTAGDETKTFDDKGQEIKK